MQILVILSPCLFYKVHSLPPHLGKVLGSSVFDAVPTLWLTCSNKKPLSGLSLSLFHLHTTSLFRISVCLTHCWSSVGEGEAQRPGLKLVLYVGLALMCQPRKVDHGEAGLDRITGSIWCLKNTQNGILHLKYATFKPYFIYLFCGKVHTG